MRHAFDAMDEPFGAEHQQRQANAELQKDGSEVCRQTLWPFSRLYFLIAQATNVLLKCLKTGYIADR